MRGHSQTQTQTQTHSIWNTRFRNYSSDLVKLVKFFPRHYAGLLPNGSR
jgi:hypothetical protein